MTKRTVILNPSARSEKAREALRDLEQLPGRHPVVTTTRAGDATRRTIEAVRKGSRLVVAAGGDGTINEVVNGLAGTDATLGILPMGTANVFATELQIPPNLGRAWEIIEAGVTKSIDLIRADYRVDGRPHTRYCAQLAGAGLDAQIVRNVSWESKRQWGALSYVFETIKSLTDELPRLTIRVDHGKSAEGSFVLVGNGAHYGGPIQVFRKASLTDGMLDLCLFKAEGCLDLLHYLQATLRGTHVATQGVTYLQGRTLEITSPSAVPVQLDGEFVGYLPARMEVCPGALKVRVPGG